MEYRRLGSSPLVVSAIGLGCMSLPPDGAAVDRLVGRALELGVTFFDTADLYQHGDNERLLGAALRAHGARDGVVVATKVGNRWRPDGGGWDWLPDPGYLRSAVDASRERLGLDTIDLLQLHGGTIDDPIDDVIGAFEELVAAGSIRAYGLSSIRPNVVRAFLERSRVASVMLQYSLLDRRPEEELLPRLADAGVAAVVRGPVAKGLLAGKPATAYLDQPLSVVERAQGAVARLAAARGAAPAQVALRYALAPGAVASAVPGASRVEQLEQNVTASDAAPLTEDELAALRAAVPAQRYQQHR